MAEKYIVRVTAGCTYDVDEHVVVPVNTAEPVRLSSRFMDAELNVRVQNYQGLPRGSPTTSPYFDTAPHDYNKDQYSIAFRFTPKKPASPSSSLSPPSAADDKADVARGDDDGDEAEDAAPGISATDLQFGNDFDHPIRDRLPPGFNTAMGIVKWWIDPGLDGDAYADRPYLYGPALSSFNCVHVGAGAHDAARGGLWFDEGGDEAGLAARRALGAPDEAKPRMKWALRPENKAKWVFEYGRTYGLDFFNPYLDFSDFSLKLPGFTLPIMKYWDGQGLRYVLRNKATGATYLVILFTLYLREDVNDDGSLKPAALAAHKPETATEAGAVGSTAAADEPEDAAALAEAKKKLEAGDRGGNHDEDVD